MYGDTNWGKLKFDFWMGLCQTLNWLFFSDVLLGKDPYDWFQWYFRYCLGRRWKDDQRQINRWNKIVSRFRDKLLKMSENSGSKYNDYSISPKIRQILLHWDYELTKKDFELSN